LAESLLGTSRGSFGDESVFFVITFIRQKAIRGVEVSVEDESKRVNGGDLRG
jgi:hypothetical protein